jgi:cell division protein FtsW
LSAFTRKDTSFLGDWWWTVDRWTLAAAALLVLVGVMLIFAASPAVAEGRNYPPYHYVQRHLVFLPFAAAALILTSMLSVRGIRRLAITIFGFAIFLMILTVAIGPETKGAQRWLNFAGISIQPSEFIKPSFAILAGWLFSKAKTDGYTLDRIVAIILFVMVISLLLLQPDFGMTVVVSVVWFTQFFLAGLPVVWVLLFIIAGLIGAIGAYLFLPHVTSRVDRFIDPSSGDSYQVERSLQAFGNGGAFGRGPGEGSIKSNLPDAHTDFIFAVAGEEFGLLVCILIVGLFAFIILRVIGQALRVNDFFVLLAVSGLIVQFGLQAFINMASTLRLMPTKGMTLPFVSYGGSSLLACAICIGMVLALTRRRFNTTGLR